MSNCTCGPYMSVIPPEPCPIHDPEARECYAQYAQYLLDNVRLDEPHSWSWGSCDYGRGEGAKRCKNPANNGARSGSWRMVLLCDEHFTAMGAVEALGLHRPAGDSIHS